MRATIYIFGVGVIVLVAVLAMRFSREDSTMAVRLVISELIGMEYEQVDPSKTLMELGCDELDVVEIVMELEDIFEIKILEDELNAMAASDRLSIKVSDLVSIVHAKSR